MALRCKSWCVILAASTAGLVGCSTTEPQAVDTEDGSSGEAESTGTGGSPSSGGEATGGSTAEPSGGTTDAPSGGTTDPSGDDSTGDVPDTCTNEILDADEEGVDCGGSCPTVCAGVAFDDDLAAWSVPHAGFGRIAEGTYATLDLDGDGLPDLVQSSVLGVEPFGEGDDRHWRVYFNTGSGFEDTATEWSVPHAGFGRIAEGTYATLDLDGDGLPDLVQTSVLGVEPFGKGDDRHWRVYFNTGSGFEDAATQWSVPHAGFGRIAEGTYATLDLDGDGLPDLVQSSVLGVEPFGEGEDRHWRLYVNTGSGFEDAATQWSVPHAGFGRIAEGTYATLDLDGDGRLDLVQSSVLGVEPFGEGDDPHWRLYVNTGNGFEDVAAQWSVPHAGFGRIAEGTYATLDLDGDGQLELVQSSVLGVEPFGEGDDRHWRFYDNAGDGFEDREHAWSVPHAGFGRIAEGTYAALDLDGDGRPDLVQTSVLGVEPFGDEGDFHWRLYRNVGE